jgi:uncharacterized membrane protein
MPAGPRKFVLLMTFAAVSLIATSANAQKKYDPGASRYRDQDRQYHAV